MPPVLAAAGAVATVAGAAGAVKSLVSKPKAPKLTGATGQPIGGISSISTPGFSFSNVGGRVSLTRGQQPAFQGITSQRGGFRGGGRISGGFTDFVGPFRAPLGTTQSTGFNPLAQENALRGRLSSLDPTGRLEGISANRAALGGIQTRSQALRADVAALRGRDVVDQGSFQDLRSRFGALSDQAAGVNLGEFGALRGDISELRGGLEGEFGSLAEAQRTAIRNARAQAVGNLRESLGRRNVLGSSFAEDALARQELEFGQAEGAAVADARVQQAVLSGQLAALEGDILNTEVSQSLARLALSGQLTQAEQSALREQSALALQEAAFKGQLLQLDAATLQQQAQNVFISMGLTDQEAQVWSQQLAGIMGEAQILQQTTTRQLQELGVAGNIANGIQANITNIANANANLAIQAAQARGDAIAGIPTLLGQAATTLGQIFPQSSQPVSSTPIPTVGQLFPGSNTPPPTINLGGGGG